eukprot:5762674-Lingulodinium_polyedra.AAC.1
MDQSDPTRIQQTLPAAVLSPQAPPAGQADVSMGQAPLGQDPQIKTQQPQPAVTTPLQALPAGQPVVSMCQAQPGQDSQGH